MADRPGAAVALSAVYLAAVLATWVFLTGVSDRLNQERLAVVTTRAQWFEGWSTGAPPWPERFESLLASPMMRTLARLSPQARALQEQLRQDSVSPTSSVLVGTELQRLDEVIIEGINRIAAAVRIASLLCVLAVAGLMGVIVYQLRVIAENRRDGRRQKRHLHELILAQDAERQRLGLELHDTLAQELSSARMQLDLLAEDELGTRERLRGLLGGSVERVRSLSWTLSPPDLGRFGIRGALARHLEERRGPPGSPELRLVDDGSAEPAWGPRGVPVFRVVQEALANALRHAQAATIEVRLRGGEDGFTVEVADDGRGFDASRPPPPGHLGLFSMEERARMIGARWSVRSAPGQGTTVKLEVPHEP